MTETIPSTAEAGVLRRRRLRLAAVGALVALAAGGTGALAATMAHRDDSTASTTPGPSVFIPYAGSQGSSGAGGADRSVASQAQLGAAAPAASGAGVASYGGYAHPYPGVCTGTAPAQVSGDVITATGSSTIGMSPGKPVSSLNAWVSAQGSGVDQASNDVQRRLGAVVDALAGAGVPRSAIHTSAVSVNVYSNGGGGPKAVGVATPPKTTTQVNVNASASVSAELRDASIAARAVNAAANAGADNVNAWTQAATPAAPSAEALSAALAQASDQAHQLAAAAAEAAGVTLGAVRSVSAQQPTACGYDVDGPQLVVGITIAYAIG